MRVRDESATQRWIIIVSTFQNFYMVAVILATLAIYTEESTTYAVAHVSGIGTICLAAILKDNVFFFFVVVFLFCFRQ